MDSSASLYPSRVLLADDDSNFRLLAGSALKNAGFQIESFADGKSLLQRLTDVLPDIVLLDVIMPELDGFSVCERIRKDRKFESLPVLVITGLDDLDSISRAYDVGATDFVTKPVNWRVLCYRVRFMIRTNQRNQGMLKRDLQDLANLYALSDQVLPDADTPLDYQKIEWLKNLRSLEKAVGTEILHSVMQSFLAETPMRIDILRESINQQDCFALQTEATQLKSKSFNLFLNRTVLLCKELELLEPPRQLPEATGIVNAIEAEFRQIQEQLQQEMQRGSI